MVKKLFVISVLSFAFYLILTIGSGDFFFLWSFDEISFGLIISVIVGIVAHPLPITKDTYRVLNPLRMVMFLFYVAGPFFYAMAKANLDVAYRVITGRINPGIVKIHTNLKTDLGITMLANSITLTPGTLTVEVDEKSNELYIHMLNVKNKNPDIEEICGNLRSWIKRITE